MYVDPVKNNFIMDTKSKIIEKFLTHFSFLLKFSKNLTKFEYYYENISYTHK